MNDEQMIADFTRSGVKLGEEAEFAAEHGYELAPFELPTTHQPYRTMAVCRGGVRLMQRQGAEMDLDCSMPPWVLVSAASTWAMTPIEPADESPCPFGCTVAVFAIFGAFILTAVAFVGHKMGFWGWPW